MATVGGVYLKPDTSVKVTANVVAKPSHLVTWDAFKVEGLDQGRIARITIESVVGDVVNMTVAYYCDGKDGPTTWEESFCLNGLVLSAQTASRLTNPEIEKKRNEILGKTGEVE
jgi:hypothetical protein